jgi:hypothetical protein
VEIVYIVKRVKQEDRAMAISHIHETLLFYTKQESMISMRLNSVMFNMASAAAQTADSQMKYNSKEQSIYYTYHNAQGDNSEYYARLEECQQNHELELATLNFWESQLELEKGHLETKLNQITQTKSSFQKLLQSNIKNDFTYGGTQS